MNIIVDAIIIGMIVVPLLIVISLIVLIIYGAVKKKPKIWITSSLILFVPPIIMGIFMFVFPTEFPYVDRILYGKTKGEVIEIYGEPELNGERIIGYYIGVDNEGIDPSHLDMYYYVCFDGDGVVDEIYSGVQPGG